MKIFSRLPALSLLLLAGVLAANAQAQTGAQTEEAASDEPSFEDLLREDTTAASGVETSADLHAYGLLPERLGPMESFMWSENGLMRKTFDMPLTREQRTQELDFRRTMLKAHQIGGFVTLAALLGTVALGQMAYNGSNVGDIHGAVAMTAVASYFTTASLAIFTPPPAIRRGEWSTVSTHKLLATVHFTGMILTPVLGSMIESNRDVRTLHLASGYATTAAFAAAMFVVTF